MIKAIETRYAGCRFRSRLEARWAVFFDHLSVKWEYEPEGFEIEDRLRICNEDSWYYLPDFWLPEYQLWVEVKGSLDDRSMRKALSTAAFLSSPRGGCRDGGGHDTLFLGPIPNISIEDGISYTEFPSLLHLHKGDLKVSAWPVMHPCRGADIANDSGDIDITPGGLLRGWGAARSVFGDSREIDFPKAYTIARSARFEHGEQG